MARSEFSDRDYPYHELFSDVALDGAVGGGVVGTIGAITGLIGYKYFAWQFDVAMNVAVASMPLGAVISAIGSWLLYVRSSRK